MYIHNILEIHNSKDWMSRGPLSSRELGRVRVVATVVVFAEFIALTEFHCHEHSETTARARSFIRAISDLEVRTSVVWRGVQGEN